MASIINKLVAWGSSASEYGSADLGTGNATGFSAGSLIYAQATNRAFRNATVLDYGIAQVLASYITPSMWAGSDFAIGYSDVDPGQLSTTFVDNLHTAFRTYARNYFQPLRADSASAFYDDTTVSLSGDVVGSSTSKRGWAFSVSIAPGAVTTEKIADGAVTGAKIGYRTIEGGSGANGNIKGGTITWWNIASRTVEGRNIAANTISSANLAESAVYSGNIADGAVGNAKLQHSGIAFMNAGRNTYYPYLGGSCNLSSIFGFDSSSPTGTIKYESPTGAFYIEPDTDADQCTVVPNGFMSRNPVYESGDFARASIIGDWAFYNCDSLTRVSAPNCKYIGSSAFSETPNLSYLYVPYLQRVGEDAFSRAGRLQSNFRVDMRSASSFAGTFLSASYLAGCYVDSLAKIPGEMFRDCFSLSVLALGSQSVRLPQATEIGPRAFYGCSALNWPLFPNCSKIGTEAFARCTGLSGASFAPWTTVIPSSCFESCANLESVPNYSTLTEIHESAFAWCTKLGQTVSVPGLLSLGSEAFLNCTNLKKFAATGGNIMTFGSNPFKNCTNLSVVAIGGNANTSLPFNFGTGCPNLESLYIGYSDGVISAHASAANGTFSGTGITSTTGAIYVANEGLAAQYKLDPRWSYVKDRIFVSAYVG